jgi:hypothetical protein
MRLPLFRRSSTSLERAQTQERLEKLLIDSLRLLGQACGKVADLIEAQRQERNLGAASHTFLRRLDVQEEPKPSRER